MYTHCQYFVLMSLLVALSTEGLIVICGICCSLGLINGSIVPPLKRPL